MSSAYTSDGRRRSSMTHARRGHKCAFCDFTAYGNGGQVSHGRKHVRAGEAVELVKHYPSYPPMSSRFFIAADDHERFAKFINDGFEQVTP